MDKGLIVCDISSAGLAEIILKSVTELLII